jgi:serine/threonine-protein kinase HipA
MASLTVWMNGQEVGTWTRRATGTSDFVYAPSWIESKFSRALSLSIPITADRTVRGPQVTNYFDNLLPDNPDIRKRIGDKWSVRTETFDLLTAIGRDCVGAVQLLPAGEEPVGWNEIRATPLDKAQIAAHLRQVTRPGHGFGSDDDDDEFRISIAGAQEKTALLRMSRKWYRPEGATPTTHILKLPLGIIGGGVGFHQSVQNEWLCSEFLHAIGMDVARTEMLVFEDQHVLSVTRFDRRFLGASEAEVTSRKFAPGKRMYIARLPQEDLCQSFGLPSAKKYENKGGPSVKAILELLAGSDDAADDMGHFLVAQLLFWLLAAPDGHAKNFSVQFTAGGGFRMTPLYDVLSAWPLIGRGAKRWQYEKVKLAMAIAGKSRHYRLAEIQARHWKELALAFGAEKLWERMVDVVERAEPSMAGLEARLPDNFPEEVFRSIFEGIQRHVAAFRRGMSSP